MGDTLSLAKVQAHHWEEPFISGQNGSGTIFFSGCNLRCVFCQNYDVSRGYGKQISVARLADIFKELEDMGVHNINLVTATHFVPQIVEAVEIYRPSLPIVYNCGGYESRENLDRLDGIVDIYLPDMKYSDNALAMKYSRVGDYFERACESIEIMQKQVGTSEIVDGIMRKGMSVRHLVLPNALDNTYGVLDWLSKHLDKSHYVSLMGQYCPCGKASEYEEIARKLKPIEYKLAMNRAVKLGLENVLVQELDSASGEYIPSFDLGGV